MITSASSGYSLSCGSFFWNSCEFVDETFVYNNQLEYILF